jgi:glucose-1-phosphate cytidylyltransferase
VLLADTGLYTSTGGRIKRVQKYIGNETFMMTYGDGVADVNLNYLLDLFSSVKVVILAGGLGSRLSEETDLIPKPMVEIGGKPILWHIMKIYSAFGFKDFIICLGYKSYVIKEYFLNYFLHNSDVEVEIAKNRVNVLSSRAEDWRVLLADTGLYTSTGGRIKRVQKYIGNETFMMTYGDGVADVNLNDLLDFAVKQGRYATVTAVRPLGRFGALEIGEDGVVKSFVEKPPGDNSWINGGFFVLRPQVFDYIRGDETNWEIDVLPALARDGQLAAYKHSGFWKPMDTLRDKRELQELWDKGHARWKIWKD